MGEPQDFGQLKTIDWKLLQALADHFQEAWETGHSVDLERFLPPPENPLRPLVLRELIIIDLEIRWRHGQVVHVEDYLERFPELAAAKSFLVPLLAEEYRIRHRHGDQPALAEYRERFPEQFEGLRHRLEDVEAISSTPSVTQTPAAGPPAEASGVEPAHQLPVAGGYKLLHRIGYGTFGEVWRAEAPGGFPAAVKMIFRPVDHEEAQRELAALEVIRGLRHPYLVQTQAFWSLKDRVYIIMELADNSLRGRQEACRQAGLKGIPPAELLRYFREAAEGLDYLHSQHVLHRDIKPENILLLQGHAKLADFGLARLHSSSRVATATVVGTLPYMPPEVYNGKVALSSDQYSLAMAYAELRLDRRPLQGSNLVELLWAALHQEPDLAPLPEAEQRVIRRALHKDHQQRYPSCLDWVAELEAALAEETRPPRPTGSSKTTQQGDSKTTQEAAPPPPAPKPAPASADAVARPAPPVRPRRPFLQLAVMAVGIGFAVGLALYLASAYLKGKAEFVDLKLPEQPVWLHRGDTKIVPLTIVRTGCHDRIAFQARWRSDDDHLGNIIPPDPVAGGAERETTVHLEVHADQKASIGTTSHIQINAMVGQRVIATQDLPITVLFFPVLPAGKAAGTETRKRDSTRRYFHRTITWISPKNHSVHFLVVPHDRDGDPATFYIMADKVSVGLFKEYEDYAKSHVPKQEVVSGWNPDDYPENYPVFRVAWKDAQLFAQWLGGKLPSTEQWDKAAGAREPEANDEFAGPFKGRWDPAHPPAELPEVAFGGKKRPRPVGDAKDDRSHFECRDMAGNGLEWTSTPIALARELIELRGMSFEAPGPLLFKDFTPRPDEDQRDVPSERRDEWWKNRGERRKDIGFRVVIEPE
jgi:serine/threonine protein kinase